MLNAAVISLLIRNRLNSQQIMYLQKVLKRFVAGYLCVSLTFSALLPVRAGFAANKQTLVEHIELHDVPLSDVLRVLSDQYGLNVVASKKAAEVSVTMFLNSVTPQDILETLSRTYNLWYKKESQSNIYRLYTAEEFRLGNVDSNREHVQVFTARFQNVLSIAYAIQNLFPERISIQLGQEENVLIQDLQTRFRKFDLFAGRSSMNQNGGSQTGGNRNGNTGTGGNTGFGGNTGMNGGSGSTSFSSSSSSFTNGFNTGNAQGGNNQNGPGNPQALLNNTELEKNLQNVVSGNMEADREQVKKAISEDARIYITVLKNQNNILVRTRDPMAIQEIERLITELDKPPITVLLEVKILSVALLDGFNSVFDIAFADKSSSLAGSRTPISTTTTTTTQTDGAAPTSNSSTTSSISSDTVNTLKLVGTGVASVAGAEVFGPALMAKIVSDQFETKLQLLEQEGRVTELATPMVSTANQEVSRINLVNEVPIVRTYNFVTSNGGGTLNGGGNQVGRLEPQVSTEQIGTTLIMTPSISKDKSVNLNLLIDRSALSTTPSKIPVENGQGQIEEVPVDTVERRSYAGNVIMKDNTPMAIGGLITERAADSESKVPVLGDVPGLGFFFKDQARKRSREELVIIITPHIIENMQEGNRLSQEIVEHNSVHPSAKTQENLNIYTNDKAEHKDYQLEKPFKEYRGQDQLDPYKWQNQPEMNRDAPAVEKPTPSDRPHITQEAQQIYMQLTRYAAKAVRVPPEQRERVPMIQPAFVRKQRVLDLFRKPSVHVLPVASWHQGGIYVTALEVRNVDAASVQLDARHLKGTWLAATLESSTLSEQRELGDSTYLYLISGKPFDEGVLP